MEIVDREKFCLWKRMIVCL